MIEINYFLVTPKTENLLHRTVVDAMEGPPTTSKANPTGKSIFDWKYRSFGRPQVGSGTDEKPCFTQSISTSTNNNNT
jgi:hypothetical protein